MKSSKAEAKYQGHPKGNQCCEHCTMWLAPSGCTAVEGRVSKEGWCKFYEGKNYKKN